MASEQVLVCRVQLKNGKGPFVGDLLDNTEWDEYFQNSDAHPGPNQDPDLRKWWGSRCYSETSNYLFGFSGIDQLGHWFHDMRLLKYLHSCGVFIAWYKVDRCAVVNGTFQVIFDQQYATMVNEQNIVDI